MCHPPSSIYQPAYPTTLYFTPPFFFFTRSFRYTYIYTIHMYILILLLNTPKLDVIATPRMHFPRRQPPALSPVARCRRSRRRRPGTPRRRPRPPAPAPRCRRRRRRPGGARHRGGAWSGGPSRRCTCHGLGEGAWRRRNGGEVWYNYGLFGVRCVRCGAYSPRFAWGGREQV